MVLDADTLKIIYRSAIRPRTLRNPNQMLAGAGGEEDHQPHSKTLKHPTLPQMVISQLSQISQLSSQIQGMMIVQLQASLCLSSIQGMMMVQLQASLCLSSTQMALLVGPFYNP